MGGRGGTHVSTTSDAAEQRRFGEHRVALCGASSHPRRCACGAALGWPWEAVRNPVRCLAIFRNHACASSKGLKTLIPGRLKCWTLPVAIVKLCRRAMAAM
jgi:hypothetical protein